jgi:hypothetical protein
MYGMSAESRAAFRRYERNERAGGMNMATSPRGDDEAVDGD